MQRRVEKLSTANRQSEGGGFIVRRPFPAPGLEMVDPFLLLDEMGPADYAPGEAVGAPDHPHREGIVALVHAQLPPAGAPAPSPPGDWTATS